MEWERGTERTEENRRTKGTRTWDGKEEQKVQKITEGRMEQELGKLEWERRTESSEDNRRNKGTKTWNNKEEQKVQKISEGRWGQELGMGNRNRFKIFPGSAGIYWKEYE